MDAAASIITLLDALRLTIKAANLLYHRLRNAPQELGAHKTQLKLLSLQLLEVQRTCTNPPETLISLNIHQALLDSVLEAQAGVQRVEDLCTSAAALGEKEFRIKWALRDRQRVQCALEKIDIARGSLRDLMYLVTFRGSILSFSGIEDLKSRALLPSDTTISTIKNQSTTIITSSTNKRVCLTSQLWRSWTALKLLGIDCTIIPVSQDIYTDYAVSMRFDLPGLCLFGDYALNMHVNLRTFPLTKSISVGSGSSLALARVRDSQDPFFQACQNGDVLCVRDMLRNGQGRTTDLTEGNFTPLATAIKHARTSIAEELLLHGADPNGIFGKNQTSHLQWAIWQRQPEIIRLLLKHGATQEHINFLGWNTAFFCWPKLIRENRCMLELFRLLSEDAIQDLNLADSEGWTVFHRVAAFGTAGEVKELVRQGANSEQVALPLGWTAIHHAVFYGNFETFKVLVGEYGDVKGMVDERGWTLLHIAASAGHADIVEGLLKLGADPEATSREFASHMPDVLFHRRCTPGEVAAAQGEEVEDRYLRVLEEVKEHNAFELEEKFVDALELLSVPSG